MQSTRRLLSTLLFLTVAASGGIRLKMGPMPENLLERGALRTRSAEAAAGERFHILVRFDRVVDEEFKEILASRAIQLVAFVPDDAYVASVAGVESLEGLGATFAGLLEASNKIGPSLVFDDPGREEMVVVEFHFDVDGGQARQLAYEQGLEIVENPDLAAYQVLVRGPMSAIQAVAGMDAVAAVYRASDELLRGEPVRACAGQTAGALPVAASLIKSFGEGWDGPGRNAAEVGYWMGAMTRALPQADARAEILKAMAQWSAAAAVTFRGMAAPNQRKSIDIFFAPGDHGDGFKFDGPGRVLAHGFYPPPNAETLAGDLHFDADEPWRIGADVDLFSVALHELGHSLGLAHSDSPADVMYPFYRRWTALQGGDAVALRAIYADPAPANPATPSEPQTPTTPAPPAAPPTPPSKPQLDTTAPAISITSPSKSSVVTSAATLTVSGMASDNNGVTAVTWSTSMGKSGSAAGLTAFTATGIPLARGTNQIVIRAYDAAGNSAWRSLTVTRR